MANENHQSRPGTCHSIAIDVGSTRIKLAQLNGDGSLLHQSFFERDFDATILDQVTGILRDASYAGPGSDLRICSSANGGLKVGIICLTPTFSGEILRNQVLLGGANPVFTHYLTDPETNADPRHVDVLLIGGGIDCPDCDYLERFLEALDVSGYRCGSVLFAGNRHLHAKVKNMAPNAKFVDNPLADGFDRPARTVFRALRDAYLDDLVHKEGISELVARFGVPVRPTPEVVNHGYYRAVSGLSALKIRGASILIDIGGATTDFHYTVEIIRDDSENRPPRGSSVARYVFADLGVFASRDTTMNQLRCHALSFDFLKAFREQDVNQTYRALREGELEPDARLLSYACIFLSIDRFLRGDGPGLPTADVDKISDYVFTGGAAQLVEPAQIARIINIFTEQPIDERFVTIDRRYETWVSGISDEA